MRRVREWPLALGAVAMLACDVDAAGDPRAEIAATLSRSAADWNRGDLDAFMSDYLQDSTLSFVSGRGVLYGWRALYDRYQRAFFAPGTTRDSLTFTDLRVRPLDDDLAFATARFQLARGDSVTASGPFTLILRKQDGRWRIVHDHTSSDPEERRGTTSSNDTSRRDVK
jgi:uncharacterized protein (TIGR02246 family)